MKTRVLAVMLIICMLLTLAPAASAEETGAVTWTVEDGVMTISGTGPMCPEDEPLPDDWPDGAGITAVVVEEGITDVADTAFSGFTELTSVTLADTVETIGYNAFDDCTALTSVTLPDSVKTVGIGAFYGCTALTSVTLPYGIHVSRDVFFYTPWLEALPRDENGFAVYQGILLRYDGADSSIEIPAGVVSIAGDFSEISLESVLLPETIVTIGSCAFEQYSLKQINFPDSLKYIGDNAFVNTSLTTAMLPEGLEYLGDQVFRFCSDLTTASVPGSLSYLGSNLFWDCNALTDVTLGEGIDCIPEEMFYWCTSLSSVELPSTITEIGEKAFSYCSELKEIVVPEGVISIGRGAFENCSQMTSAVLPESLKVLHDDVFWGCTSLAQLNIPDGVQFLSSDGLEQTPWLEAQYDENGFAIIGRWLLSYRGSNADLVIPDSVERIASYALDECDSKYGDITSLTLPDGLEYIGKYAFSSCRGLTELIIPDTVTFIDERAFDHCSSLQSIELPDSVTTLGVGAFKDCGDVTRVTLSVNLTEIPQECFYYCDSLESIEIPEGVTTIGHRAFHNCTSMCSITIPASVTTIEDEAVGYRNSGLISDFTIYGYTGTAAEAYANKNGIDFVALVPPVENPFTDVPAGSFFEEPVLWAVANNITNGLSATEFGPNATCNRAQVVTFLWRAAGCPEPTSTANPFVDVQSGSFYEAPVLWAVEMGITNGSDATHFNPGGVCNRAQVVTFLYRAFESPDVSAEGLPFTDVPAGAWYEAPIAWAVANGITNGISATEFGPNASCNRAQVVTFLYRAYQG